MTESALYPLVVAALRWRYVIITVTAFAFCVAHIHAHGDWEFFVLGSQLLLGQHVTHSLPGGLRLYAFHPQIQIGPLALLVATPFRVFGGVSRGAAAVAMTACVPALVYLLERLATIRYPSPSAVFAHRQATVLVGGVLLATSWALLSTSFSHLDDLLVLACVCVGMWAVLRDRPLVLGTVLGLAVAAKPWAVIAFPMLLVFRGRDRWKAGILAVGISFAAWAPFILADHHTLEAIRPNTDVSPASVVHLFGTSVDGLPGWIRPAQLVASLLVGVLAVRRGRWAAVPAVGIAARLLLDPGVWGYYSSGLILAALAWDLLRSETPSPTWAVATFVLLDLTTGLSTSIQAALRFVVTASLIVSVLVPKRSRQEQVASSSR